LLPSLLYRLGNSLTKGIPSPYFCKIRRGNATSDLLNSRMTSTQHCPPCNDNLTPSTYLNASCTLTNEVASVTTNKPLSLVPINNLVLSVAMAVNLAALANLAFGIKVPLA
jgi:hypothetical protein